MANSFEMKCPSVYCEGELVEMVNDSYFSNEGEGEEVEDGQIAIQIHVECSECATVISAQIVFDLSELE